MITLDFFIDYNVALCLFGNIIFWLFDTNTWISLKNIYIWANIYFLFLILEQKNNVSLKCVC